MPPLTAWKRLVRYSSAKDGETKYGEPILSEKSIDITQLAKEGKLEVSVLEGSDVISLEPTGQIDQVGKLLGPLMPSDVPIIRCIGLNYRSHSECNVCPLGRISRNLITDSSRDRPTSARKSNCIRETCASNYGPWR